MGSQFVSRVAYNSSNHLVAGQVLGYILVLGQFSWLINRMHTS